MNVTEYEPADAQEDDILVMIIVIPLSVAVFCCTYLFAYRKHKRTTKIPQIINKEEFEPVNVKNQNKHMMSSNDNTRARDIDIGNELHDGDTDEDLYDYGNAQIHERITTKGECTVGDNDYQLEGANQIVDVIQSNVNVVNNDLFYQNITEDKNVVTTNDVTNTTTEDTNPGAV